MILLTQTMIQIVAAGGGLVIDLEKHMMLSETMIQIAAMAGRSGALVTFKIGNRAILSETMLQIAAAGRGRVIFDIG